MQAPDECVTMRPSETEAMMRPILDLPAAEAQGGPQRRKTMKAMREGQPLRAAPKDQVERRRAYVREHWPELEDDIEREGIIGVDDTLWSSYLGMGARCADAVGRICWRDEPAQSRAEGTGFLVANSALLTNHHVIDSSETAAEFVVEFGYEYDIKGGERRPQLYNLDPGRLLLTDETLDFALVAVAPARNGAEAGSKRGFLPLISQVGKVRNGESLNLIHHPSGDRKKVTIRESRLLAIEETQLQYTGDTLGGSSGSPVLNDQWEVVGLHFGGKPKRDAQGRKLTLSGEPWQPGMAEHLKAYEFNVASRTSRILMNLEKRVARLRGDRELLRLVLQGGAP